MIARALLLLHTFAAEPLTEEQAVAMALQKSPSLSALDHRVEETRAWEDAAGDWNNPEVRVQNLRSNHLDDRFEKARIGLRWTPPELGKGSAQQAEAGLFAARASSELESTRRAMAARVRSLHATVLGLDAQIAVARESQQERERLRKLVQRRVERQAATIVDQSAAEVDALDAFEVVQELEIRRRQAYGDLLAELGLPAEGSIALSGQGAPACAPPADDPTLQSLAVKNDPRTPALRAELRAVDAERTQRWLSLAPWFTYLQASYVLRGDDDPAYWTFQFGISLPLFDWKVAERRSLTAKQARLEDQHRAETAELDLRLRRALTELAEQAALVQRHRESAKVLEDGLQHFLRNSETTGLLQASQLRTRMLAARRAHLRAELECRLKQIEVDRIVGPRS